MKYSLSSNDLCCRFAPLSHAKSPNANGSAGFSTETAEAASAAALCAGVEASVGWDGPGDCAAGAEDGAAVGSGRPAGGAGSGSGGRVDCAYTTDSAPQATNATIHAQRARESEPSILILLMGARRAGAPPGETSGEYARRRRRRWASSPTTEPCLAPASHPCGQ